MLFAVTTANEFGSNDVLAVLQHLARERPVFHADADFQQALAWSIHTVRTDLRSG